MLNFETFKDWNGEKSYNPEKTLNDVHKCIEIFKKYPKFEHEQLKQFVKDDQPELLDEFL